MNIAQTIALAMEAAEATMDAHQDIGTYPYPYAKEAYDFIRNVHLDSFDGSDEDAMAAYASESLTAEQRKIFEAIYYARIAEQVVQGSPEAQELRRRLADAL